MVMMMMMMMMMHSTRTLHFSHLSTHPRIYLFYVYLSVYLSVGYCYQKGVGVVRDEEEAVRLYVLAGR